jgi:hypothetical protein
MLPFTKRPARNDDGPNSVVVDNTHAPVTSKRGESLDRKQSVPPPSLNVRPPEDSFNEEDDLTGIMQSRSFTGPIVPNRILPAAGRPASLPPTSRRAPSVRPPPNYAPPPASRPPPSLARGHQNEMHEDAEDEDGGRTVLRTAPKIVKTRNAQAVPASISPAAIIKTTLESARASSRRDSLMTGPPADLLEDSADLDESRRSRRAQSRVVGAEPQDFTENAGPRGYMTHGGSRGNSPFEGPPSHRPPPMSMEGPPSYPPPASNPYSQPPVSSSRLGDGGNHTRGMYGARPENMSPHPQAAPSVPAAPGSMPAHFMTPQAPYADPPGTSVTAGHRVAGRPAVSWAAALLACGLFVGVVAVAVMQSSDAVADTTASFVDPARTPAKANGGAQVPMGAAPTPVPVSANGVPTPDPATPAPPAGLIGASPVQAAPPPVAEQQAPRPAATPNAPTAPAPATAGSVVTGFAPVAVATPSAPPKRPAVTWRAPPPPAPKAAAKAVAEDDTPPKKADAKPAKSAKKGEPDDETKKALEALQKAQLESASSF